MSSQIPLKKIIF